MTDRRAIAGVEHRPMADDELELMTLEEAAATLHKGFRVSTLRRAIHNGDLVAKKLGSCRYYVSKQALKDFLTCHEEKARPVSSSAETNSNGSSETARSKSGQDLVSMSVAKLKQLSANTSPAKRCGAGRGQPTREI